VIQKGIKSLENPMLRGSFMLVLDEETLNSLDKTAKTAFLEIMSDGMSKPTATSPTLNTIHLSTSIFGVHNNRAGVYVIKNVQNGRCVVGQTINLRRRFNQYTNRCNKGVFDDTMKINQELYNDVQQTFKTDSGLDYSQFIQRYVVRCWVGEDQKPIELDDTAMNEMLYLEHRLILAFFECGLLYNTNDSAPRLRCPNATVELTAIQAVETPTQNNRQAKQTGHQARPFKINGLPFYSAGDYLVFRSSLAEKNPKKYPARQAVRAKLKANEGNLSSDTRYLTSAEIEEAEQNNSFIRPTRKQSPWKSQSK
jgi:hypothetical protein